MLPILTHSDLTEMSDNEGVLATTVTTAEGASITNHTVLQYILIKHFGSLQRRITFIAIYRVQFHVEYQQKECQPLE